MPEVYTYTHINKRSKNEDCCLAFTMCPQGMQHMPVNILLVADGMGGHSNGEKISRMAVEEMAGELTKAFIPPLLRPYNGMNSSDNPIMLNEKMMGESFIKTNEHILAQIESRDWDMGGTTLVAALVCANKFLIGNVGDSLSYHWVSAQHKLLQITHEHSVPGILHKRGFLSQEEVIHDYRKNQLVYFIGMNLLPTNEELENTHLGELADGDVLMLCSDGICGNLSCKEMETIFIAQTGHLEAISNSLIGLSKDKGQKDNQTIVLYKHNS